MRTVSAVAMAAVLRALFPAGFRALVRQPPGLEGLGNALLVLFQDAGVALLHNLQVAQGLGLPPVGVFKAALNRHGALAIGPGLSTQAVDKLGKPLLPLAFPNARERLFYSRCP